MLKYEYSSMILNNKMYNKGRIDRKMEILGEHKEILKGGPIMANIQITSSGIKKSLQKYNPLKALVEFIWNGFDAQASSVKLTYSKNVLDGIDVISIADSGYGIPKNELDKKFKPFLDSEKIINPAEKRNISTIHGKNGVGRLTFYHFATDATWETIYQDQVSKKRYKYTISINNDSLDNFNDGEIFETDEPTGTKVTFINISGLGSIDDINTYLGCEFCWFLELNKDREYTIKSNGIDLDYSINISDSDQFVISHKPSSLDFEVRYIQWKGRLNDEYSQYYFLNSENVELFKDTTSLNNKGDHFYHSVYVKGKMFDDFNAKQAAINQLTISGYTKGSKEYKFLKKEIDIYLRKKRKPFLVEFSNNLINDLEKVKAFPNYDTTNFFENAKKNELESVVREIYQIQPKIFASLNIEQKKILVRFLDLIMQSGECGSLLKILDEIIELDSEEREELACLLNSAKMTNIIKTISLIKDRYKAIDELKQLVFNKSLHAKEVPHLQNFIERHYWIFGEQYNLVTAAEPDFEEALRRYGYILNGENVKRKIDHVHKNKEMDIFAVRQDISSSGYNNIVIELKHPDIKLGEKELSQVKKYMSVILSQPEFNANNMHWEFYLIGNDFNKNKYIENEIKSNQSHGEKSLVFKVENYKIYVKTWSAIFAEFEMKHKYLNDKLEIERGMLIEKSLSANSIIYNLDGNAAIQPSELIIT